MKRIGILVVIAAVFIWAEQQGHKPRAKNFQQTSSSSTALERHLDLSLELQRYRFGKYVVKISDKSTAQDAISCVRGYLEACSTPLARKIDPFYEIA